jgi:DNA-directed RNA polymerase alpha subunit
MPVRILSSDSENATLLLTDVDKCMVNGLRRILIAEVPSCAIDTVTVESNTSKLMCDDYIIPRMQLIPIYFPSDFGTKCDCKEGCTSCTQRATIEAQNTTTKDLTVKSNLIRFADSRFAAMTEIPICVLRFNEHFKATITVKMGIGRTHAKYMSTSMVNVRPVPSIHVNPDLTDQQKKRIFDACPKGVFEQQLNVVAPLECTYCNDCLHTEGDIEDLATLVQITPRENEFVFYIESIGPQDPMTLWQKAIQIYKEHVTNMLRAVKALKT